MSLLPWVSKAINAPVRLPIDPLTKGRIVMFRKTLVCVALLSVVNASDGLALGNCRTVPDRAPAFAQGAYLAPNGIWYYRYTSLFPAPHAARHGFPTCSRRPSRYIAAETEVITGSKIRCYSAGALTTYVEISLSGWAGIAPLGWISRANLFDSDPSGFFQPRCNP
jgi:hypothetical protein